MIFKIAKKTFDGAAVNYAEVARYAGAKTADESLTALIKSCIQEYKKEKAVAFSVCYTETPLSFSDGTADFNAFRLKSNRLVKTLFGADRALIFACTIGIGIDRLIKKYSEINPSRALVFQALGAERTETFIDVFIADYEKENGVKLTPRFSPGYGDLPLDAQRQIFGLLNPQKHLGLTLNDSLLMSPAKSVTAIAGIMKNSSSDEQIREECGGCKSCDDAACEYRR